LVDIELPTCANVPVEVRQSAATTKVRQISQNDVQDRTYDVVVIGGGINGVMAARDAAGRGLSVLLVEQGDIAGATSSASSKLIHGGLRYLEHFAFRLVRESLREREIVLRSARHLVRPMRFVMPHAKGSRPAWMIRLGLWLYDHIGGPVSLPRSAEVDLTAGPYAEGLKKEIKSGFAYSDCWVDDARYVVMTALNAVRRGTEVMTRTCCAEARRDGRYWRVSLLHHDGTTVDIQARAMINAAGPWVRQVLTEVAGANATANLLLVKGSHIVIPRLHGGDHALILQNDDGRVVFVVPFEQHYSLIGTTELVHEGEPGRVEIKAGEIDYLCAAVNRYFERSVEPGDEVWSFAGLRPLYDDGRTDLSSVTRDYVLEVDRPEGMAPLISIFGGKLTTARQLAERVVNLLNPPFLDLGRPWTTEGCLPGGEMDDFDAFAEELARDYPGFDLEVVKALARRHGTCARAILGKASSATDLGRHFGGGLYAAEVNWLVDKEWAREPDDVLWRRTKCGLEVDAAGAAALANYMTSRRNCSLTGAISRD